MIAVGIVGAGYQGKLHIVNLQKIDGVLISGFYDPDDLIADDVIKSFELQRYATISELYNHCDAVDIVAPASQHYNLCLQAIIHRKHIFVEKPVTETVSQANQLKTLLNNSRFKFQVGLIERFSPVYLTAAPMVKSPIEMQAYRMSQYHNRGADVSVVLDLLIHDIDLVVTLADSHPIKISCSGNIVQGPYCDYVEGEILFLSGCIARLKASRVANHTTRVFKIKNATGTYYLDFITKRMLFTKNNGIGSHPGKSLDFESVTALGEELEEIPLSYGIGYNSLQEELRSFINSISRDTRPPIGIDEAMAGLKIAEYINQQINSYADKRK